ncbi:MAG: hypothetical protein GX162_04970 [Firmicutes bacterium]|jgi:dienelactone hydrolase|nr:hypothetical protein [Bacillota bacterium]
MHIKEYLNYVAERITADSLATLPPASEWEEWRRKRKQRYLQIMGLDRYLAAPRTPLNIKVTQTHQRDGYRVECLSYESLPGLIVAANLYIPDGAVNAPAILYVCGHSRWQKASHYQQHARRYAQLGFVTLIVDTIEYGEVRGYHHGTYRYGAFQWVSRGYTPAAVEVWNGIRGIDLLCARPEVDASRIGVTGTSGGGAITWWLTCADDRVAAASSSCGTSTIAAHVRERTIDGHCDCMFPMNPEGWSLIDFAALVAPRPMLIVSADRDGIFTIDSINEFRQRLGKLYEHLGVPENLDLFTFRAHHSYQPMSRRVTFRWFLRHLADKDLPLDQVEDIDGHAEEMSTLEVFGGALPANDRSTTVQDWFVPVATPPQIEDKESLKQERERVVSALKAETFATFPDPLPDPQPRVAYEAFTGDGNRYVHLRYTPEENWDLAGVLYQPVEQDEERPIVIELANSDDRDRLPAQRVSAVCPRDWLRAYIFPRGTGETGWNSALNWHLRRAAALTGRTLASLRVLDVLQGLRALRSQPGVDPDEVYLAARGEMAAVALYAALLDGNVAGVILCDPPATQNAPDSEVGVGPLVEMLHCLRITDLPQVAGLLWPSALVFVGPRPESYLWAEDLYTRLGKPGGWWHLPPHNATWNPARD